MSTPTATTEQFTAFARRSQEAGTAAVEGTTSALRSYAEAVAVTGPRPVDPHQATTATFDLAEKLLSVQREYVTTTVAILTEAGETVSAQASAAGETFKARTEAATARVVDLGSEATRRTAAAAADGVSA